MPVDPEPATASLSDEERRSLRYGLSGLIDDLVGATDRDELAFIANGVLVAAGELFLLDQQHWPGTGKWLGRRLLDEAPQLHARLIEAHRSVICAGEVEPLRAAAMESLDCAGGWLQEGTSATARCQPPESRRPGRRPVHCDRSRRLSRRCRPSGLAPDLDSGHSPSIGRRPGERELKCED